MVQLTLTEKDAGTLVTALETYMSDLRMEIADTDAQPVRDGLKREELVITGVVAQLRGQSGARG